MDNWGRQFTGLDTVRKGPAKSPSLPGGRRSQMARRSTRNRPETATVLRTIAGPGVGWQKLRDHDAEDGHSGNGRSGRVVTQDDGLPGQDVGLPGQERRQ